MASRTVRAPAGNERAASPLLCQGEGYYFRTSLPSSENENKKGVLS